MCNVTRKEMRELDRKATYLLSIPSVILMENAGRSVADIASGMVAYGGSIVVVCGKGNNGGDGFVCARHLHIRGFNVKVVLLSNISDISIDSDAGINLNVLVNMKLPIMELYDESNLHSIIDVINNSNLIVDAIFGTGLTREVGGFWKAVIDAINHSGKKVLSIDIPSGLDCDNGVPLGIAIRADKTVTVGLPKIGFQKTTAREYTGEVVVADIGVPYSCL